MVYQEKLVAAVKVDGKTLRESNLGSGDSEVFLPFGSEYSLFFKNMQNRKVQVGVNIDGREAIKALLIDANTSVNLERFLGDSTNDGNRFKFIEKSDAIKEHRGDQPEDGLIEIRYKFEKEVVRVERTVEYWEDYHTYPAYPIRLPKGGRRREDGPLPWKDQWTVSSDDSRGMTKSLGGGGTSTMSMMELNSAPVAGAPATFNDQGITVEGSHSNQSFRYGHIRQLETQEHVIIFHLRGETLTSEIVEKPVTTRKRVTCKYCGKRNTTANKFCGGCGAAVL